jgi:hypothetical protein
MSKESEVKRAVQAVIKGLMDRVMNKVLVKQPFIVEEHHANKPLYAALVPDEIFKGSHFERRFVTPFGTAWEVLAVAVGRATLGFAERNATVSGTVKAEQLRRIQEVLNGLDHPAKGEGRVKPDWDAELKYVLAGGGEDIPIPVICDVYMKDTKLGKAYSFELKAPLPNSDQTKVSKEKLLKLYCMEPRQVTEAFYALPYNPYGKRGDYKWSPPMRWFNMKEDKVVLIGDEFWEKVGGKGAYQSFITAVNEIAPAYKERIYREYLGIEPPDNSTKVAL